MAEKNFPKLKNAPVIEALVDIQVCLTKDSTVSSLEALIPESISEKFPTREERKMFEAGIAQSDKGKMQVSATDHGTIGLLLRDIDNQKVVQIRPDGFGFSHLQPYSDFDTFRQEARELWKEYKNIANVKSISRVTLLYINILDFGKKITSLREFGKILNTVPNAPHNLNVEISTFYSQFGLSKIASSLNAVVTQHSVQNVQTGASGIRFQIDCSKTFDENPTEEELWKIVDELRIFKNEIFFGSVDSEKIKEYELEIKG